MPTILTTQALPSNTYKITAAFTDENDQAVTPNDGCTWTLADTEGTVINSREDVAITEATSVDIFLTGDDLASTGVYDDGIRVFTIEGTYDSGSETDLSLDKEIWFVVDTVKPVSIYEAKSYLNLVSSFTTDDVIIAQMLNAAYKEVETWTGRKLLTQTVTEYWDDWPDGDAFELPYGTLQSVTSVKYKDSDGTENTLSTDDYIVETAGKIGRVVLAYGETWPSTTLYPSKPIYITYVCGYGANSGHVPGPIKTVIKMLTTDAYENRDDTFIGQGFTATRTKAAEFRIWPYKIYPEAN